MVSHQIEKSHIISNQWNNLEISSDRVCLLFTWDQRKCVADVENNHKYQRQKRSKNCPNRKEANTQRNTKTINTCTTLIHISIIASIRFLRHLLYFIVFFSFRCNVILRWKKYIFTLSFPVLNTSSSPFFCWVVLCNATHSLSHRAITFDCLVPVLSELYRIDFQYIDVSGI